MTDQDLQDAIILAALQWANTKTPHEETVAKVRLLEATKNLADYRS